MWRVLKGPLSSRTIQGPLFHNKTVHKQVSIFTETLINIFSNFIPNKYITFNDRDPPWMNDFVKTKIKFKNQLYNTYGYKGNDYNMLHEAINDVSKIISKRNEEYLYHLASKLNYSSTSGRTYWPILKTFYNGKKVPLVPPLQTGNTLVSDFKMKAKIFNEFFASQCVPFNNDSSIPYCRRYMANAKICSIKFENKDIFNVIKAYDPCKAHGYEDISLRVLKICDSAIVKPLTVLFKNCISECIFTDHWKKSNICPIH